MEDNADIERIRSINRENFERERRNVREENINSRRQELASAENNKTRVNYLNPKSPFEGIKVEDFGNSSTLSFIKNNIIKDEDNIAAFFKIPGGLHALIGQLTGNDPLKHCLAAECLCNLSLGRAKWCLIIARAAGAYLLTFLDSADIKIVEICTWTLGNLSASDLKVATLLKDQGFLDKVIAMTHYEQSQDEQHAAFYALAHFIAWHSSLIYKNDRMCLINYMSQHRTHLPDYALKILFILSSDPELEECFAERCIFTKLMEQLIDTVKRDDWHLYAVTLDGVVKILANLCCQAQILDTEIPPILDDDFKLTVLKLLTCKFLDLRLESCWLFGNILNTGGPSPWKKTFQSYLECAQKSILPLPML